MGRRASPWPAILPGPEQVLGARWLSLFRAAPRPVQQALRNVWASIAPGGTLPITVPSLARLDPHLAATDFWRWTLVGVAALWGLSVEDLSAQELDVNDPCFPLVACAYAAKPA
jgi:hypothetical protein